MSSRSTSTVRLPLEAKKTPRLAANMLFPIPPFAPPIAIITLWSSIRSDTVESSPEFRRKEIISFFEEN
jgi:hypothetical protein